MGSPKKHRGFSLIEVVVGSATFAIIALSAYGAFSALMTDTAVSRAKITATALANEKFEIIRNLPYSSVGIVSGIPSGVIAHTENVIRDNYSFVLTTSIRNVDDPYDGTIGGNPNDLSPADYKTIDLDIDCLNCKYFPTLSFNTLVAPRSIETATNNGALFIRVFDAAGIPVPQASLHIVDVDPLINPIIVIDEVTDNDGWLKIIDAVTGSKAYNITATKTGYSQDQTYTANGAAGGSPVKPNATVVQKQVTQISFAIDLLSSLNISSINTSCAALPNAGFTLSGTKLIGASVLKYNQAFTTDGSGQKNIPNLEWDTYSISPSGNTYDIAGVLPTTPFPLSPNDNESLQLIAVAHSSKALLISVKDTTGAAIDGAVVHLQIPKSSFDQTKTTSSAGCSPPGQVFWNGLSNGNYILTVSKAGYQNSTTNPFTLGSSSPNWQQKNITLTPQ